MQKKTKRHLGKREASFHRESLRTSATRTPPPRHAREPPRTERIVTLSPDITTNTRTRLALARSVRRRLRRAPRPRPRALTSARSHSHHPRSGAPQHRAARRRRGRYPHQLRAVPIPRRGCHSGTKPRLPRNPRVRTRARVTRHCRTRPCSASNVREDDRGSRAIDALYSLSFLRILRIPAKIQPIRWQYLTY